MTSADAPLLSDYDHQLEENATETLNGYSPSPKSSRNSEFTNRFRNHWSRWKVIYACALFIFILDFPSFMRVAPFLRLIELGVCRDYYQKVDPSVIAPNGDIDESLCKLDVIQSELANMRGLLGSVESLPGMLLAIPYGIMADYRGRRLVMLLCCFGALFAETWGFLVFCLWRIMPVTLIFFFPVFLLIGGGGPVFAAVITAVVADVCPSHLRTRVFFLLTIVLMITELISPPTGAILMDTIGAQVSYGISVALRLLSFLFPLFIPETKPKVSRDNAPSESSDVTDSVNTPSRKSLLRKKLDDALAHVRQDVYPLISRPMILFGMFSLLINTFARSISEFLLQYMTIRFQWRYADGVWLLSFSAAINIALLCTVLPLVHWYLDKHYGDAERANLLLAKGSVVFLIAGPVILGVSERANGIFVAVVVFTFGQGFGAAMRSFLTSLVSKNQTALLYTMISIFSSLGTLVGTPLIGLVFSLGIKKGGAAIALPFFVGAALYFCSGLSIWFMKVPKLNSDEERDQETNVQLHE